jgi:hypothetical protein
MNRNGFAQINGVAVTAFVLCLAVGALLGATMHKPAPVILLALPGLYPAVRHQGSAPDEVTRDASSYATQAEVPTRSSSGRRTTRSRLRPRPILT